MLTVAVDAENINSGGRNEIYFGISLFDTYLTFLGVTYIQEAHLPAFYEFRSYANIRSSYKVVAPDFLKNFVLIATIRISNKSEGYLFSIGIYF